jgi:hypothetical protein
LPFLFSFISEQQNEQVKFVSVEILSDTLPEPDETVIVYLAQPTGDARIAKGAPDGGKKVGQRQKSMSKTKK